MRSFSAFFSGEAPIFALPIAQIYLAKALLYIDIIILVSNIFLFQLTPLEENANAETTFMMLDNGQMIGETEVGDKSEHQQQKIDSDPDLIVEDKTK